MFKSYLKIAVRNLIKHRVYSLVNIGGLTVGMSAFILILLYVSFELSYDNFHTKSEQLFRIRTDGYREGIHFYKRAKTYGFVGPELQNTYPEISQYTRLINLHGIMGNLVMSYGNRSFEEEKMYYTDPSFLKMFSFPLLERDVNQALTKPHTAVITETAARKYFGNENPMGKNIVMNGKENFLITGILKDIPQNSHLKFDFLLSFATIRSEEYMLGWADFFTYVLLKPNASSDQLNAKIEKSTILSGHFGDDQSNKTLQLSLQPLKDIHLHSHMTGEAEPNDGASTTYGLLIVAFIILIIAWINYVNLSTARSLNRAREVGVRKVVGARRGNLISQFLMESFLINCISAFVSVLLVSQALPFFNNLTGQKLSFIKQGDPQLWFILFGFFFAGGLLSSFYPAFVLSAFQPMRILKGIFSGNGNTSNPRKALIIFQFTAAVILIIGAWAVSRQVTFMRNQELGIDIEQTLIVKAPSITDKTYADKLSGFKTQLLRHSDIRNVTVSSNIPGRESTWGSSVTPLGNPENTLSNVIFVGIDYDFIESYQLDLVAGRNFSRDFPSDRNAILMNESAVSSLGIQKPEQALGKQLITWRDSISQVVGIIKNHHQLSLRHGQSPTVYFLRPAGGNFYSVKVNPQQISQTIAAIKDDFETFFPENPFDYFFLDEYFNRQYQADQRFGQIFGIFSGLAILIAALGLFALASNIVMQRTKEIGIRKVLGASLPNLLILLSKDFLLMILIAAGIALPFAVVGVKEWLQNYAYRMEIGWELFVLPPLLVIILALLIVCYQAFKAAITNLTNSLRYE